MAKPRKTKDNNNKINKTETKQKFSCMAYSYTLYPSSSSDTLYGSKSYKNDNKKG